MSEISGICLFLGDKFRIMHELCVWLTRALACAAKHLEPAYFVKAVDIRELNYIIKSKMEEIGIIVQSQVG